MGLRLRFAGGSTLSIKRYSAEANQRVLRGKITAAVSSNVLPMGRGAGRGSERTLPAKGASFFREKRREGLLSPEKIERLGDALGRPEREAIPPDPKRANYAKRHSGKDPSAPPETPESACGVTPSDANPSRTPAWNGAAR